MNCPFCNTVMANYSSAEYKCMTLTIKAVENGINYSHYLYYRTDYTAKINYPNYSIECYEDCFKVHYYNNDDVLTISLPLETFNYSYNEFGLRVQNIINNALIFI